MLIKKSKKTVKSVRELKTSKKIVKSPGIKPSANDAEKTGHTKVHAIQCLHCLDIIYSCARHDFHSCSCGKVMIDGGFDYTKINGEPSQMLHLEIAIPATKEQLYADWNMINNIPRTYGCIQLTKVNSPVF